MEEPSPAYSSSLPPPPWAEAPLEEMGGGGRGRCLGERLSSCPSSVAGRWGFLAQAAGKRRWLTCIGVAAVPRTRLGRKSCLKWWDFLPRRPASGRPARPSALSCGRRGGGGEGPGNGQPLSAGARGAYPVGKASSKGWFLLAGNGGGGGGRSGEAKWDALLWPGGSLGMQSGRFQPAHACLRCNGSSCCRQGRIYYTAEIKLAKLLNGKARWLTSHRTSGISTLNSVQDGVHCV